MDYTAIKTNKKMNEVVKEQLIFRDDHLSKYAAKRIEELEQLVMDGVVLLNDTLCLCGQPELPQYSPCCSLKCWHDQFD